MQKKFFEKMELLGFKVLGEYGRASEPISYVCKCGERSAVRPDVSLTATWAGCVSCSLKKRSIGHAKAKEHFERLGMKLLSEYKNRDSSLLYLCSCGKEGKTTMRCVLKRSVWYGCSKCAYEKRQENMKKTCKERYGDENAMRVPAFEKKRQETCMKRYGVSNPSKLETVQAKVKATYKTRTGYDHPSHNPEHVLKNLSSCFRKKEFSMPSGSVFICQGYEPLVLKMILSEGFEEEDIFAPSSRGITIPYRFEDKNRVYNPDIFIESQNILVEVKSEWTFDVGGTCERKRKENLKKLSACREQGFNTRLYIFDGNEKLVYFQERLSPKNFEKNATFEKQENLMSQPEKRRNKAYSQEEASKFFSDRGCKLLSEYKRAAQKHEFLCRCGETGTVSNISYVKNEGWSGCSKCRVSKKKAVFMDKFGLDNPMKAKEIKKKFSEKYAEKTSEEKEKIKKKRKETNLERFDVENVMHNEDVREEHKKALVKRDKKRSEKKTNE